MDNADPKLESHIVPTSDILRGQTRRCFRFVMTCFLLTPPYEQSLKIGGPSYLMAEVAKNQEESLYLFINTQEPKA